ncbi:MAG: MmgE/PrpD family protein, partial [Alphaproteobacteria bacterium]|nr:MmgE/PrpD family protein [Alphaproteobacteria bacterium]
LTYALAYPFAIMAVHGEIGPDQLQEDILHDDEVQRISQATELVDDDHYTRISVDKRWADVTLYLSDGREIQSDARTPRGDPDNPLSDQEISDKFHLLADAVIGRPRAGEIEELVSRVERDDFDMDGFLKHIFAAA